MFDTDLWNKNASIWTTDFSMLNFCKLVMECYVGPSVTRCHQKLTRTCTCCIFVMFILFGCMLFQQCPICLGWRSESRASKKMHLRKHVCSYLSYCKHPSLTQYDGNYILLFFVVHVWVCLCVFHCMLCWSIFWTLYWPPRVGEIKVFVQYSTAICCSCDGLKISWRTSMSRGK